MFTVDKFKCYIIDMVKAIDVSDASAASFLKAHIYNAVCIYLQYPGRRIVSAW